MQAKYPEVKEGKEEQKRSYSKPHTTFLLCVYKMPPLTDKKVALEWAQLPDKLISK